VPDLVDDLVKIGQDADAGLEFAGVRVGRLSECSMEGKRKKKAER
jgi:hypothetical protein